MSITSFQAAVPPNVVELNPGSLNREVLLVIGCSLLLAIVLFCWAMFFRKTKQRSRSPWASVLSKSSGKRRRRRSRHVRPMNPTLAETGGLPPPRDEPDGEP